MELLVVLAVVAIVLTILLPAVEGAREAARRALCQSNLGQIGLALQGYHATHGVLPFGVGADDDGPVAQLTSDGNRRYSLHSQLLSYLDQDPLFNQLNFRFKPFHPDTSGIPGVVTGLGPNETAAVTRLTVFLCPSDTDRMRDRPWGKNNYRSCNGSSWAGRAGDGMFGQITSIRMRDVTDGLSHTAAFSERIRGHGHEEITDMDSDLFGLAVPGMTEQSFRVWCEQLSEAEASTLILHHSFSGQTWLEGNMNWTRYNHFMSPGRPSCGARLSWEGVAMTANSRHARGVNLLLGDGAVRFVSYSIDASVWQALGTVAGGEQLDIDSF